MTKRIGQMVQMTDDAIDNYGEQYRGKSFKVTHKANKYMPAHEFFAKGKPQGYHPGYDEGVGNQYLYDLEGLGFSLYDWELK